MLNLENSFCVRAESEGYMDILGWTNLGVFWPIEQVIVYYTETDTWRYTVLSVLPLDITMKNDVGMKIWRSVSYPQQRNWRSWSTEMKILNHYDR